MYRCSTLMTNLDIKHINHSLVVFTGVCMCVPGKDWPCYDLRHYTGLGLVSEMSLKVCMCVVFSPCVGFLSSCYKALKLMKNWVHL